MAAPLYHTAEMVRSLIDETRHWPRYETVHGELLVTPAPRPWHQSVTLGLATSLTEYLRTEPVGKVFMSPADISWGPDSLVQPDVFVVPLEEARTLAWPTIRTLMLAVEVLSSSSVLTKRRLYRGRRRGLPGNRRQRRHGRDLDSAGPVPAHGEGASRVDGAWGVATVRACARGAAEADLTILPEDALNGIGYGTLRILKMPDLAIWIFRRNAAKHPESANVYDSLGDGLLAKGDTAAPIAEFRRAVDIGRRTKHPVTSHSQDKLWELEKTTARADKAKT